LIFCLISEKLGFADVADFGFNWRYSCRRYALIADKKSPGAIPFITNKATVMMTAVFHDCNFHDEEENDSDA
jgi:hypothetical protein